MGPRKSEKHTSFLRFRGLTFVFVRHAADARGHERARIDRSSWPATGRPARSCIGPGVVAAGIGLYSAIQSSIAAGREGGWVVMGKFAPNAQILSTYTA